MPRMLTLRQNPFNLSFVWIALEMTTSTPLFYRAEEDDWPSGRMADYIMEAIFMEKPRILKQKFRFKWADKTGSRNPNGSFDGAIGLVASSKADAYIMPIDYHSCDQRFVEPSTLLHSINYVTVQPVIDRSRGVGFSSLLELVVPPPELLMAVMGGVLLHLLALFLFSFCLKVLLRKPKRSSLETKILAFFFLLFSFFSRQLYLSNLRTDKISVDVSGLLHNEEQILNTEMQPCFLDEDGEMQIFKGAHTTTLAYKVFLKMNKTHPCFIVEKSSGMGDLLSKHNMNKIFLLGVDSAVSFQSKVVQLFVERDTYTNSIPIWQSPRTMILRKDLRKDFKLYFDLTVNLLREFDFLNKAFRDFPYSQMLESRHQTDSYGRDLYTNFNSLQAYINRHTSIAPLSFADLDYLFRLFFLLLVSPLVHLLAVKLARWALVHLQPIRVIFRAVFARFGRIFLFEVFFRPAILSRPNISVQDEYQ